jgi:hypothetical protein
MADRVVNVCGIDYSTRAIDAVFVDLDDIAPPLWIRHELVGEDAWERTRQVRFWSVAFAEDVLAVGLEEPRGRNAGALYRVQGAILARLPGRVLVEPWVPSQWRKAVGLSGSASKTEIRDRAESDLATEFNVWPQDACDAYCIALATRAAIELEPAA